MGDSELEGREVLLKHVSFEQRLKERWDLIRSGVGGLCGGEEQCHGLVCVLRLALLPCRGQSGSGQAQ